MGEGRAALARGSWVEARAIFEREVEARETVDALEGLSWAAWWVEDVPACLQARERAYRLSRRRGDMRRAAMLAIWLADDHLGSPLQEDGASTVVPGLFFVGVHFLRKRKSSTFGGVGEDAGIVARRICARLT